MIPNFGNKDLESIIDNNHYWKHHSKNKIKIGFVVQIEQKQDQHTGKRTEGIVKRIPTPSKFHPHGNKVELENGKIERVQNVLN